MSRPNLLFIITDHHAWYNHFRPGEFEVTFPTWERFCADGIRFERAYSVCPLCSPCRSSMMTGLYPSAHGIVQNTDQRLEFRPGQRLYSHYLAQAGYRNAYVGKWHCGHERLPVDFGIEGWSLPDYGQPYMSEAYRQYATQRHLGEARAKIEHCHDRPQLEGGEHTLHHQSPWFFMNASGVLLGPPEAHEEQFVAHLASQKLRELAATRQPFSLVASFWGPHQPYYPSEPFAGTIDPAAIPEYPSFRDDLAGRPARHLIHRELHHPGAKRWRDWSTWQQVLARAYGQQLQLDAAIGQVLATLDEVGGREDTLVIWCADHGDAVASHGGMWDKAAAMTEEVMRVPLAVRWPGELPAGRRATQLVGNLDVTATLLEAAGVDRPENMHSRSLLPICRDGTAAWPDAVICEHHGHGPTRITQRAIITDRYKYVAAVYDGDELYDLQADPYEMNNLVEADGRPRDPAHAPLCRELRGRILEHIRQTGDPFARNELRVILEHANA